MPAISGQDHRVLELHAREWQQTVGQSGMTPTAFSFLIPVFIVAIVAPFLCIFCIRRRRRTTTPLPARPPAKVKKPALRRAEAREKLNEVTEVSTRSRSETEDGETPRNESQSVLEKECAICLSTLYAPAPPEPAKLPSEEPATSDTAAAAITTDTTTTTDTTSSQPQSTDLTTIPTNNTTSGDTETILRLTVCSHEFHAECLVSWFVLRKTSCPICRSLYMSKEAMDQYDEEERIALGGETSSTEDVEAQVNTAAVVGGAPVPWPQEGPRMPTWRYLLYGRDAYQWARERRAREQAEAQAREQIQGRGIEMSGVTAATNTTTTATVSGGNGNGTEENAQQQEPTTQDANANQPAQPQSQPRRVSIWRRYFTTG